MNARHLHRPALVAVALMLAATAADGNVRDPLRESFERMLVDEPARRVPPGTTQGQADPPNEATGAPPRERTLRASPRNRILRAPPRAADPVAESFARMLEHTPTTHVPPVPAGNGDDPLVAALVEPMRRWVAESAAAAGHGIALTSRTGR